jgi:hypothetical protein
MDVVDQQVDDAVYGTVTATNQHPFYVACSQKLTGCLCRELVHLENGKRCTLVIQIGAQSVNQRLYFSIAGSFVVYDQQQCCKLLCSQDAGLWQG